MEVICLLCFVFGLGIALFSGLELAPAIKAQIEPERQILTGTRIISRSIQFHIGRSALVEIVEAELSAFANHPSIRFLSEIKTGGGNSIEASFGIIGEHEPGSSKPDEVKQHGFDEEAYESCCKKLFVMITFLSRAGGFVEMSMSIGSSDCTEFENSVRDSAMNYLAGAISTRVELINVLYNVVLNSLAPIESVPSLAAGDYLPLPDTGLGESGLAGSFGDSGLFAGPGAVVAPSSFEPLGVTVAPSLLDGAGAGAARSFPLASEGTPASTDECKCAGCGKMTSKLFSFCMYCGASTS